MKSISYTILPFIMFLLVLTAGGLHPLIFGGSIFYVFILSSLFFLLILLKKFDIQLLKTYFTTLFSSMSIVLILQFFNTRNLVSDELPQFLFRVGVAITVLFLYSLYRRNINKDIYLILKIVALHSFLNFILGFFIEPLLMTVKVEDIIEVKTFYYFTFYESKALVGGFMLFRNQGLFWEPGVLSVFLNIFFYLSLFEYKEKFWSFLSLFLILTTFSTTGLLLVFLQILVYLKSWIKKNFLYFIPGLLLISALLPLVINNVTEKFRSDNGSFIARLYDYQVALYMMLENFLTGIGFGNQIYLDKQNNFSFFQDSSLFEPRLNTNSIVMVLVSFGLPLGFFILHKFYNQRIFERKLLFFLILVICLSSEPIVFTGFFLLIMYSSFFLKNNKLYLND
jgi:hypothetical protein